MIKSLGRQIAASIKASGSRFATQSRIPPIPLHRRPGMVGNTARLAKKRPKTTAMLAAGGLYAGAGMYSALPGAHKSRRNQNDRVLRRIRSNQAAQLNGLESMVNVGGIRPRSSGGYTL